MHLYKAKLYLLGRTVKPLKKEIRAAMGIDYRDPRVIVLKSHMEYLRQNLKKSLKILNPLRHVDQASPLQQIYSNNVACIHFRNRLHANAAFYFSSAIKTEQLLTPDRDQGHIPELLYNLGLQKLLASKPEIALSCFEECTDILRDSPLLWLRKAECCLLIESLRVEYPPHTHTQVSL